MKKIDPSNTVIRHRSGHTQQNKTPVTQPSDGNLGERITLRRRHPNPEPIPHSQPRQLIEYNCSSNPEGQCPHCGHRLAEEHNDDIRMMEEDDIHMMEEDDIHSDKSSSDDEPTSCFSQIFGCCLNIPWISISIGALIGSASASIGWYAHSIATNNKDITSNQNIIADQVPPVTQPVVSSCSCNYKNAFAQNQCLRACKK